MTVSVVVPMCRSVLSDEDKKSLDRLVSVLGEFAVTVACPEGMDVAEVEVRYPSFGFERFDSKLFAGQRVFNELLLSRDFYERFLEWDYILIHQSDSFVFRNELQQWCDKGYDYIGSPWLFESWHRSYIYLELSGLKSAYLRKMKGIDDYNIARGKVGDGGFSLRKTRAHYDFLNKHADIVDHYKSMSKYARYNEDVFWAVEPAKNGEDFKVPKPAEAVRFAFAQYPDLAHQVTDYTLPFACRGFNDKESKAFWKPIMKKISEKSGRDSAENSPEILE